MRKMCISLYYVKAVVTLAEMKKCSKPTVSQAGREHFEKNILKDFPSS